MMRFDYAHDMAPEFVDRVRALHVRGEARGPLMALATVIFVGLCAFGIESWRVGDARTQERVQQVRFDESRARLEQMKIASREVSDLLLLDRRLRDVRLSGTALSVRLADIANHVPERAWLTSLGRTPSGVAINGRAETLDSLSATVASLMMSKTVASPNLIKAETERHTGGPPLVKFEISVAETTR